MRTYSLKMFIKFLAKNRLYTFVTLSGFAISLMFVLLLSVYIKQELSVDQFHTYKERIYRLIHENYASFGSPTGVYLKNQFPEMEAYTRLYQRSWNATFQENRQERVNFTLADSAF
jgi:putative ABC transport system permease protein